MVSTVPSAFIAAQRDIALVAIGTRIRFLMEIIRFNEIRPIHDVRDTNTLNLPIPPPRRDSEKKPRTVTALLRCENCNQESVVYGEGRWE